MTRGLDILLGEILSAIDLLRVYTEGLGFDEFAGNVEKQDAVIRRLEIIGEKDGWARRDRRVAVAASHPDL